MRSLTATLVGLQQPVKPAGASRRKRPMLPEQFAGRRVALDTMLAGLAAWIRPCASHGEIEHAVGMRKPFTGLSAADVVQELAGAAEAADHAAN